MATKQTLFDELWLDPKINPDFAGWLQKGCDKFHGFCRLCKKEFSLGNMGRKAVSTHNIGQKHRSYLNVKSSNTSLKTFFSKPNASVTENVRSEETNQEVSNTELYPATSTPTNSLSKSVDSFCYKEEVTSAEIQWALNVVQNKLSLNSCDNISETFKNMFPDSAIASKFQMGKTKCSYVINHGLAPYFDQLLKDHILSHENVVVCFDEALNKVVQRGQMDIFVRYFDININKVCTRYYNSVFLGHATAQDLLEAFNQGIHPISRKSVLQVSMDGPNVNLSFMKKFCDQVKGDNADDKQLVNIGVCGLHVLSGALKTGIQSVKWELNLLLRDMYYLLHDSPARRADYTSITGSRKFPLKHCTTRWLENVKCLERALEIIDDMNKFVSSTKTLKTKPFQNVSRHLQDKFIKCKLSFYKLISSDCEPFLRKFQSPDPLAPYLFSHLQDLLRVLLGRLVKSTTLHSCDTPIKLITVDLHDPQNLVDLSKLDVGFQTTKYLKNVEASANEVMTFRKDCQKLLIKLIEKFIERSPLQYRVVKGLSALDPTLMLNHPNIARSRMKCLLEDLFNANRITDTVAEKANQQFASIVSETSKKFREKFSIFKEKNEKADSSLKRLDTFYASFLSDDQEFKEIWEVVKISLIFSHGNASVEGGFSINKSILVENLHEETLIAQRKVYDAIIHYKSRNNIDISHKMLLSVKSARRRYEDALKAKKEKASEEEKAIAAKRKLTTDIKRLEDERKKVRLLSQIEDEKLKNEIKVLEKKKKSQ